jgi:hypothetical protein
MKMIKHLSIALMAILTLSIVSCTKDPDILATESKLPTLQLSSLGYQQTGPFTLVTANATATAPATIATILQLNFGATATKTTPGAFKLEVFDGTTIANNAVPVKTVNFTSWLGKDATSTATVTNHTISYVLEPTTYPNTNVYGGTILLKLGLLGLSPNKTYSVRATASNSTGTVNSVLTQLSFFKTI